MSKVRSAVHIGFFDEAEPLLVILLWIVPQVDNVEKLLTKVFKFVTLPALRHIGVFNDLLRPFYESHTNFYKRVEARSYKTYRRVGAIVLAYSFSIESDSACTVLLPMADQLNATPTTTNAHLFYAGNGSYEMQAIRDIADGEEVVNTYGERPNSELLLRYGYVANPNPAKAIAFSVEEMLGELFQSKPCEVSTCSMVRARAALCIRRLRREGSIPSHETCKNEPFAMAETLFPVTLSPMEETCRHPFENEDWQVILKLFGTRVVRSTVVKRMRLLKCARVASAKLSSKVAKWSTDPSMQTNCTRRRIQLAQTVRREEMDGMAALTRALEYVDEKGSLLA